MRAVRKTENVVASDIEGAAPDLGSIFDAPGTVAASLCLVRLRQNVTKADAGFLGRLAVEACQRVSELLQAFWPGAGKTGTMSVPISRVRLARGVRKFAML
jgi:hypothetical protein